MMISLEKARALKEAGLVWELQEGDWFSEPTFAGGRTDTLFGQGFEWDDDDDKNGDHIWLPRLDQMLAEIEKLGYKYSLNYSEREYFVSISKREHGCLISETFRADTPEDATSDALLYLLGREQSELAQEAKGEKMDVLWSSHDALLWLMGREGK